MDRVSNLIIQKLQTFVDSDLIILKHKAINTLFPLAIFLEQVGQQGMINAILRVARASTSKYSNLGKFMWRPVVPYISRLFEKQSPTSLNRVIVLISPYVPAEGTLHNRIAISRWAEATMAVPYTEEVGQSVVDALLQISFLDILQPHIPIEIWGMLKKRPSLPPITNGIGWGRHVSTIICVRGLGDIDILKSYFLLAWRDNYNLHFNSLHEMENSMREDFGGVGMEYHRKELIEHLDHVLRRLSRRRDSSFSRLGKTQYTRLKEVLLEGDRR